MMLRAKQKGFTLLELLVVITLLAILSVGALVAYDGIGENAQATAGANNTAAVDRAIRAYKAVSSNFPSQWDNLAQEGTVNAFDGLTEVQADAKEAGNVPIMVSRPTRNAFGSWNLGAAAASLTKTAVIAALDEVGVESFQETTALATGVEPNLQHNEGANSTGAHERKFDVPADLTAITHVSVMPSSVGATACTAGTASIGTNFAGDPASLTNDYGRKLNIVHDSLEADECQLVVALGFGHDAAHSTASSPAAIATAATYNSKNVNPANNYARFVALFHVGTDGFGSGTTDNNIDDTEIFKKARLIAIVDTEGNGIDKNIAKATAN